MTAKLPSVAAVFSYDTAPCDSGGGRSLEEFEGSDEAGDSVLDVSEAGPSLYLAGPEGAGRRRAEQARAARQLRLAGSGLRLRLAPRDLSLADGAGILFFPAPQVRRQLRSDVFTAVASVLVERAARWPRLAIETGHGVAAVLGRGRERDSTLALYLPVDGCERRQYAEEARAALRLQLAVPGPQLRLVPRSLPLAVVAGGVFNAAPPVRSQLRPDVLTAVASVLRELVARRPEVAVWTGHSP